MRARGIEAVVRQDRMVIAGGLVILTALGWLYLWRLGSGMAGMDAADMAAATFRPWSGADVAIAFAMWAVMMVAMMTPGAAPVILLYAAIARKARAADAAVAHTGAFATGYLAVWAGFSAVATLAQWALERAALLAPAMVAANAALGGTVLVAAGLYQFSPLKHMCLRHCRSPAHFVASQWRPGAAGAFRMGLRHGTFCVGCCWGLMALLFVGGVMNLAWIAILSVFVLTEKLLPRGEIVARIAGGGLVVAGAWMLIAG